MKAAPAPGWVVILNGAPRSGKTSIAEALVEIGGREWVIHGVDAAMAATPTELLPGIGLRPGGERPDLEAQLPEMFDEMYAEVARLAGSGRNVAVDVGHYDDYSTSLGILSRVREWLEGIPTLFVGVRCDLDVVLRRRDRSGAGYVGSMEDGSAPGAVVRWQSAVHDPGDYNLEVDTTSWSPADCATQILAVLDSSTESGSTS